MDNFKKKIAAGAASATLLATGAGAGVAVNAVVEYQKEQSCKYYMIVDESLNTVRCIDDEVLDRVKDQDKLKKKNNEDRVQFSAPLDAEDFNPATNMTLEQFKRQNEESNPGVDFHWSDEVQTDPDKEKPKRRRE